MAVCSQHTAVRNPPKSIDIRGVCSEHTLFPAIARHPMSSKTKRKHARRAFAVEGTTGAWGVTVKLRMESKLGKGALHTTTA